MRAPTLGDSACAWHEPTFHDNGLGPHCRNPGMSPTLADYPERSDGPLDQSAALVLVCP